MPGICSALSTTLRTKRTQQPRPLWHSTALGLQHNSTSASAGQPKRRCAATRLELSEQALAVHAHAEQPCRHVFDQLHEREDDAAERDALQEVQHSPGVLGARLHDQGIDGGSQRQGRDEDPAGTLLLFSFFSFFSFLLIKFFFLGAREESLDSFAVI